MLFDTKKPSFEDFKLVYPKSKLDKNIYKIWRWFFIGKLSLYVSWIAARLNITPNQITYLSFFVGLIGIYFFSQGSFLIGALLINLWYLLDCSDGHLARYYKIKSKLGKFLDDGFGEIIIIFMWFALGWGLFKYPDKSISFIYNYFNLVNYEYIIFCGSLASISIALKSCISNRFPNNYVKNNNKFISNNKPYSKKYLKILWTNCMGFAGIQGPLLIVCSYIGCIGALLIFYSTAYFLFLIILIIYFINKLYNLSNE